MERCDWKFFFLRLIEYFLLFNLQFSVRLMQAKMTTFGLSSPTPSFPRLPVR